VLVLADGRQVAADNPGVHAVVSQIAGEEWHPAREQAVSHFDAGSVHLVTSATLARLSTATGATVEPKRLRPNILLQVSDLPGFIEDTWIGRELVIGCVRLRVTARVERCVMTNHSQTGLRHRPEVLKAIGVENAACAGIYRDVVQPGTLTTGTSVSLSWRFHAAELKYASAVAEDQLLPGRCPRRPRAHRVSRARRTARCPEAREPGDSGARPDRTALLLAELAADVSDWRGGALSEGAVPDLRLQDDRLPLLRLATGSPGRRASAVGGGLRRPP
jgi:MOSC domain-containing protein YiiM